jgi:hypothetical protein
MISEECKKWYVYAVDSGHGVGLNAPVRETGEVKALCLLRQTGWIDGSEWPLSGLGRSGELDPDLRDGYGKLCRLNCCFSLFDIQGQGSFCLLTRSVFRNVVSPFVEGAPISLRKSPSHITSDGQSVCRGVEPNLGLFFFPHSYGLVYVGHPL